MRATDQITRIAEAVADGTPVDWLDAESAVTDEGDRAVVRLLRRISDTAAARRLLSSQSLAPDADSHGGVLSGSLRPGETWGHLRIAERIGSGGFAEVYRAWDTRLDREVALKLLRRAERDEEVATAAVREGRALARIKHPNVVAVYGAERIDGRVGVWMELVSGRSLHAAVLTDGPLSAEEACVTGLVLCRAVAAVHAAGLLHRDIKPHNVVREHGGRVVLMDLGAAYEASNTTPAPAGTPMFMAPELFDGAQESAQSDIYSLGALLFFLLTGTYVVEGASIGEVRAAHRRGDRRHVVDLRPEAPASFAAMIERALDPDPQRRFQSAGEMERALRDWRVQDRQQQAQVPSGVLPAPHRTFGRHFGATAAALALATIASLVMLLEPWRPDDATEPIVPRSTVLVAEFVNRTEERDLDGALEAALQRELTMSRHVSVAPPDRIADTLRLMKRPSQLVLDADTAREVAIRDGGIHAIVSGSLTQLAGTYVVQASMVSPADGRVLAMLQAESAGLGGVAASLRTIAREIRMKLGEGADVVQAQTPALEQVTTPSLGALRLYSKAAHELALSRFAAAEQLVREALQLDADFAAAEALLGWALAYQPGKRAAAPPHFERAAALAGTATEAERLLIMAAYEEMVRQDSRKAIALYEALLALQPEHHVALNSLTVLSLREDGGQDLGRRWQMLAEHYPNSYQANLDAAYWMFRSGARDPEVVNRFLDRAEQLAGRSDTEVPSRLTDLYRPWGDLVPAYRAWLDRDPGAVASAIAAAARLRRRTGEEADRFNSHAGYMHLAIGQPEAAAGYFTQIQQEAWRPSALSYARDAAGDIHGLREQLARVQAAREAMLKKGAPYEAAHVLFAVRAGLVEQAAWMLPPAPQDPDEPQWQVARAAVLLGKGHVDEALSLFRDYAPRFVRGSGTALRATELYAYALSRTAGHAEAAALLDNVTRMPHVVFGWGGPQAYEWTRLRMQLADCYRQSGRFDQAALIETDLARLWALAEPTFVEVQPGCAGPIRR